MKVVPVRPEKRGHGGKCETVRRVCVCLEKECGDRKMAVRGTSCKGSKSPVLRTALHMEEEEM